MRGRSHPPLPGRTSSRPKAWYERVAGAARLSHDRALIAEHYSTLSHRVDETAGRVHLEGPLIYVAECGIPTEVQLRVDFPFDYPAGEPLAFDAADRFLPHDADRHFSTRDGCCCLWLPPKSRWDPNDPDALRTFLDEVVVFFDRQLVYDAGGRVEWPGGQHGHGDPGYMEWVVEEFGGDSAAVSAFGPIFRGAVSIGRNDPCPCGKGVKYKRCHGTVVERVRSGIGLTRLRRLFPS